MNPMKRQKMTDLIAAGKFGELKKIHSGDKIVLSTFLDLMMWSSWADKEGYNDTREVEITGELKKGLDELEQSKENDDTLSATSN